MSDDTPQVPPMPDLGAMMDGLAKVQALQDAVYEGTAGGGLVTVTATGRFEVRAVEIRPEALADPDADAELVADLVLAALHDLTAKITAAQQAAMPDLPDLGGLGNLLGG